MGGLCLPSSAGSSPRLPSLVNWIRSIFISLGFVRAVKLLTPQVRFAILAHMPFKIDEIAKDIALHRFVLSECLHVPIAARDEE